MPLSVSLPAQGISKSRPGGIWSKPFERTPKLEHDVLSFVRPQLENGRWLPGDRLPAKAELSRGLAVTRAPAHATINVLEAAGVASLLAAQQRVLARHWPRL